MGRSRTTSSCLSVSLKNFQRAGDGTRTHVVQLGKEAKRQELIELARKSGPASPAEVEVLNQGPSRRRAAWSIPLVVHRREDRRDCLGACQKRVRVVARLGSAGTRTLCGAGIEISAALGCIEIARVCGVYAPWSDERDRWELIAAEHDAAREKAEQAAKGAQAKKSAKWVPWRVPHLNRFRTRTS